MAIENSVSGKAPMPDTVRTNVRLSPEQYARLKEEARITGVSVPTLLRNAYFRRKPIKLLLDATDRKAVFADLRRIGNNVNQIAKRVNSGLLDGWYPEFQTATQNLVNLETFLAGIYGVR